MSAAATAFQRSAAPFRLSWSKRQRHALQAFLRALDRLAPPRPRDDAKLSPEWFKYPPI
jgi:hypothetical protein